MCNRTNLDALGERRQISAVGCSDCNLGSFDNLAVNHSEGQCASIRARSRHCEYNLGGCVRHKHRVAYRCATSECNACYEVEIATRYREIIASTYTTGRRIRGNCWFKCSDSHSSSLARCRVKHDVARLCCGWHRHGDFGSRLRIKFSGIGHAWECHIGNHIEVNTCDCNHIAAAQPGSRISCKFGRYSHSQVGSNYFNPRSGKHAYRTIGSIVTQSDIESLVDIGKLGNTVVRHQHRSNQVEVGTCDCHHITRFLASKFYNLRYSRQCNCQFFLAVNLVGDTVRLGRTILLYAKVGHTYETCLCLGRNNNPDFITSAVLFGNLNGHTIFKDYGTHQVQVLTCNHKLVAGLYRLWREILNRNRFKISNLGDCFYFALRSVKYYLAFHSILRNSDGDFLIAYHCYVGNFVTTRNNDTCHLIHSTTDETQFTATSHRAWTEHIQFYAACELVGVEVVIVTSSEHETAHNQQAHHYK